MVDHVEPDAVVYNNDQRLPFDLLVSFPPYVAAVAFPGLPADGRGFLQTVLETRRVVDHPEIYAVGDAGDFPVKQAFLAFLQADAPELYRVGSSPTWRLGKKLLGVYLPWRFGAGEPFHAGLPWKGMEIGLKVMSRLLAA